LRCTHSVFLACTSLIPLFSAFSCSEGEFLDMRSQECQKCSGGTYSLGTGVAFDEWDSMPAGFISHGMNMNIDDIYTNCSKSVSPSVLLTAGVARE
jgi:hypothetical protein